MSNEQVQAEQDSPKNLIILAAVVATCVAVIVMVVGVDQFYRFAVQDEINAKQQEPVSPAKRELRASEAAKLGKYQWVDRSKGVVRIPLADARALTLRDWASRPETMPAPAEAVPAPAPAPAPAAPQPKKGGK
jgi:hypothetical protein